VKRSCRCHTLGLEIPARRVISAVSQPATVARIIGDPRSGARI
jgi:hypothetical protein